MLLHKDAVYVLDNVSQMLCCSSLSCSQGYMYLEERSWLSCSMPRAATGCCCYSSFKGLGTARRTEALHAL